MRVRLKSLELEKLFKAIGEKKITSQQLAKQIGASSRTIRDWRQNVATIPLPSFRKLAKISEIAESSLCPEYKPDFWHTKDAGRKGGYARLKIHGDLGTPEGRRKGGLISSAKQQNYPSNFKTLKKIKSPRSSEKLAEFMGIMFGDGHLAVYQASVTTNSETDEEHARYVAKLFNDLFGVKAKLRFLKYEKAVHIIASSKNLVHFLHSLGMPIGNKIENNLSMPKWIVVNTKYQEAFIRGLFDTDGCVYLDHHTIKGKEYLNLGWTITSYADKFREEVLATLVKLGFSPTCGSGQKSVFLRRNQDIRRFFSEIKTHNPKHQARYLKFIGGVPKWS